MVPLQDQPPDPDMAQQQHPDEDEESAPLTGTDPPRRSNRRLGSRTGERCLAVYATAIDAKRLSRYGYRLCYCCLGLLSATFLILGDELIMHQIFGLRRDEISCPSGTLTGHVAQKVCIGENTVSKVPRSCADAGNAADLFSCKWTAWKQIYVNNRWEIYAKSPIIPNVLGHNKTTKEITFERVKRTKELADITPDYEYNREQLGIFDAMLGRNGHLALDVKPFTRKGEESNVLLDDSGRMHIIDFNLLPAWLRSQAAGRDSIRVPLFDNIYGRYELLDWVVEGGMESDLVQRALMGERDGTGRRLGKGWPRRGGASASSPSLHRL